MPAYDNIFADWPWPIDWVIQLAEQLIPLILVGMEAFGP
jgi:hypothetical protein